MSHYQRDQGRIPGKFEVIFVGFGLMRSIVFNKTEGFVGRSTGGRVCQVFCSGSGCGAVYRWFLLLEIAVVGVVSGLGVLLCPPLFVPTLPI